MLITVSVEDLVATIAPGDLVAIPPDYSGVAMAATRALVARGLRGLRLIAVPTSGLQADVMIGAGLVAEKGVPFMPLRGLLGTDILAQREDWRVGCNPFATGDDPIVLLPAIRPDVALFHAPKADREGNVWIGRRRELATMAHAARRALVTVEHIVDGSLMDDEASAAGSLPALYVGGIAIAPRGAWPLGCQDLYDADEAALARYATAARTETGFAAWLADFMRLPAEAA